MSISLLDQDLTFKNVTVNVLTYNELVPSSTAVQTDFSVHLNTNQSIATTAFLAPWAVSFNAAYFTNANFNLTTGVYTVPLAGKYQVSAMVGTSLSAATTVGINVNGSNVAEIPLSNGTGGSLGANTMALSLNAGDLVALKNLYASTLDIYQGNPPVTLFSIVRLS